jgi:hypothetical protein
MHARACAFVAAKLFFCFSVPKTAAPQNACKAFGSTLGSARLGSATPTRRLGRP